VDTRLIHGPQSLAPAGWPRPKTRLGRKSWVGPSRSPPAAPAPGPASIPFQLCCVCTRIAKPLKRRPASRSSNVGR